MIEGQVIKVDGIEYRKSSFSSGNGGGECVYLGELPDGDINLLDSKTMKTLRFTRAEIAAFVEGAKNGEFDNLV